MTPESRALLFTPTQVGTVGELRAALHALAEHAGVDVPVAADPKTGAPVVSTATHIAARELPATIRAVRRGAIIVERVTSPQVRTVAIGRGAVGGTRHCSTALELAGALTAYSDDVPLYAPVVLSEQPITTRNGQAVGDHGRVVESAFEVAWVLADCTHTATQQHIARLVELAAKPDEEGSGVRAASAT